MVKDIPLLTKEQFSIRENVSSGTVSNWISAGKITGVQIGRRVLIPTSTKKPARKPYTYTGKYRRKSTAKSVNNE